MKSCCLPLYIGVLLAVQAGAQTTLNLIPTNSTWRYFKGTTEASSPTNAWREPGFDDSSWLTGPAPLHYGTNALGGDDQLTGGTILSDMPGNYNCVFLRQEFVVNTNNLQEVRLGAYFDDGWIAWLNGQMVRFVLVRPTDVAFDDTTFRELPEAQFTESTVTLSMLQQGTNVLAVQAFNWRVDNEDFQIDMQLTGTYPDVEVPEVVNVNPLPDATVTTLTQITVTFSEPVTGVAAEHLLVNGFPASTVTGADTVYTYSFAQPAAGAIAVRFDSAHTIVDGTGNRLDELAPSSSWNYTLVDATPPVLVNTDPIPGAALASLTQIQVDFSEPVAGVDAGDLLVNGQPALSVTPAGAAGYIFEFASPPVGGVEVAWAVNHGITDQASIPNAFVPAPATWSYIVVPESTPLQVWVPANSDWRYFKGTSEASSPTNAWREPEFDDASWLQGATPFHYGTNPSGGDDELTGGTILSDMRNSYSCIFMRREFVADTNGVSDLTVWMRSDDGYVLWINGQYVNHFRVGYPALIAYNNTPGIFGPEGFEETLHVPLELLHNGTNVIAVQAFNWRTFDSDFRINVELTAFYPDVFPPTVFNVEPPPGSTLSNLTEITVAFSEEVTGVVPEDFLINGSGAVSVTGAGNVYTFAFAQPVAGRVQIQWDQDHFLTDTNGNRFDETAPESSWEYILVDGTPPTVLAVAPAPGTTVASLTQVRVEFSESVVGIDAGDLRINGQAANSVVPVGPSTYLFTFDAIPDGPANVTWNAAHGIADYAIPPNPFVPSPWSYTVDSTAIGDVVINEFSALWYDASRLKDEDNEANDWIELHNRSTNSISLLGWSLTTDREQPEMWTFPNVTLAPDEYRLVFASGKDRKPTTPGGELHANFRLNQFGEYLALYRPGLPPAAVSEYAPEYPEQRENISYGFDPSDQLVYYPANAVTPGAANPAAPTLLGVVRRPEASVKSGFFDQAFDLVLSSATPGATIRYTLDGSLPESGGTPYSGPIRIAGTARKGVIILRAAAFKANWLSSRTLSRTYIFPQHVLTQPADPDGFPAIWDDGGGKNDPPGDYEMDPQVLAENPEYRDIALEGLRAIPTVSVMTDMDLIFNRGGFYPRRDDQYHVPVNMEYILPDGSPGFNIDCGMEMQGQTSPNDCCGIYYKTLKLGLRVMFKGEFGAAKLHYKVFEDSPVDEFDTLMLAGGHNRYWNYMPNDEQRLNSIYIRDQFVADLQNLMGGTGVSHHGEFVHLYLNGLYWGLYQLHERPDDNFMASYYGGDQTDWDVFKHTSSTVVAGSTSTYNTLWNLINSGSIDNAKYAQIQEQLDVPEMIDYLIANYWAGNTDWNHKNMYASHRKQGGKWRFHCWDSEHTLWQSGVNVVNKNNGSNPTAIFQRLKQNFEFRLLFADHVHKHFFNDGIFYVDPAHPVYDPAFPERNHPAAFYMNMIHEIETPIVCESLRWGDVGYQNRTSNPLTRDDWYDELYAEMGWPGRSTSGHTWNWFPQRSSDVLAQFRSAGVYPNVEAPSFNQHGGRVAAGFVLTMTAPAGTIYYTTDGSDPRTYGSGDPGTPSPSASIYQSGSPVVLQTTTVVKARVLSGSTWSALNEATFNVGSLGIPLRIVEIMYNPSPGGAPGTRYEFLELQNIGGTALDLSFYRFEGISFQFPGGSVLNPGARIVLGSGEAINDWPTRYPGVSVAGWYGGSLRNSGERLEIHDGLGFLVTAVEYSDGAGWPPAADGLGSSLEIIDPNGNPNDPANWQASLSANGTPGLAPAFPPAPAVVLNEIMADNVAAVPRGTNFPDWIELRNLGGNTVDLSGWSLTDDGNTRKFVLPAGASLNGNGYLRIWCDNTQPPSLVNGPDLNTGFALNRNGETVTLYDGSTNRVDAMSFGPQVADASVGRVAGEWALNQPTPAAPNQAAAVAGASNLVINEWLANSSPGSPDWFELHNRNTTLPVALQGIYVGTSNALHHYQVLAFVAPDGFVQLFADAGAGLDHVGFNLPKEGGAIEVFDPTGASVDKITYGAQGENVSQGRLPDDSATIEVFPVSPSPAASNYELAWTGPHLNEVMARNHAAVISPSGRYPDWVEIRNPGSSSVSLAGMALSDAPDNPDEFVLPFGVTLPGHGHLVIWCDGERPASRTAGGELNAGFSLNGDSGAVYLFDVLGRRVDQVEYGFQVQDQSIGLSSGRWQLLANPTPGQPNAGPASLGSAASLRFNEWMAASTNGPDWFELYNRSASPVELSGYYLTDDPSILGRTKNPIAPLSFIGGHDWVVYVADRQVGAGRDHVAFALDAQADTMRLYTSTGVLLDTVDFGGQTPDVSEGLLPDGASTVVSFAGSSSPGHANYLPLTDVVINEVLAHTDDPLEDAIELHNPTGSAVDLANWFLSNSEQDLARYQFPPNTSIPAGGYLVVYEFEFNPTPGVPPSFALSASRGDTVYLAEASAGGVLTGHRTQASFGATENGRPLGRIPTSVGVDFGRLAARTFGAADPPSNITEFRSGTGAANAGPQVGPVVINEIMFHPTSSGGSEVAEVEDDEFIELLNISDAPVTLYDPAHTTNHWRLQDAVAFEFPDTASLDPGEYCLVVNFDPALEPAILAAFRTHYSIGPDVAIYGPWSGRLGNHSERVALLMPDTPQPGPADAGYVPNVLVDQVVYADTEPWPTNGVDGGGASLQRIVSANYGNDPVNWKGEAPTAGRENVAGATVAPTITAQPQDLTVLVGETATFVVEAAGTPPPTYQWRRNGAAIPGATGTSFTIAAAQPADAGDYSVQVTNSAGQITSASATLTVLAPPQITDLQPLSQTIAVGGNANLAVTAIGTLPLEYQWSRNGFTVPGENSASLAINNAQLNDAGDYRVVVSNSAGSVTSQVAQILVKVPPAISSPPQSLTITEGNDATFTVSATGDQPLSYLWYVNGAPISGATGPTLTLTAVPVSDDGNAYHVVVSNEVGSTSSAPATLTVLGKPVLENLQLAPNGILTFSIRGADQQSYILQSSTDFLGWADVSAQPFAAGQTISVDTVTNGVMRFFRAREQ